MKYRLIQFVFSLNFIGVEALDCPVGQEPSGLSCVQCKPGFYKPDYGSYACFRSRRGFFVAGSGATWDEACPSGSYQPNYGSISCELCPAGYFTDGPERSSCTICSAAFYCPEGSRGQTLCPPGTHQPNPGQASCLPCPAGTYSAWGATSCSICPPGSFCPDTSNNPVVCPIGQYQPNHGSTSCLDCPPGKNSGGGAAGCGIQCGPGQFLVPGSQQCQNCQKGEYQPLHGQSICFQCPPGTTSNTLGRDSCDPCGGSLTQPYWGQSECFDCPLNSIFCNRTTVICDSGFVLDGKECAPSKSLIATSTIESLSSSYVNTISSSFVTAFMTVKGTGSYQSHVLSSSIGDDHLLTGIQLSSSTKEPKKTSTGTPVINQNYSDDPVLSLSTIIIMTLGFLCFLSFAGIAFLVCSRHKQMKKMKLYRDDNLTTIHSQHECTHSSSAALTVGTITTSTHGPTFSSTPSHKTIGSDMKSFHSFRTQINTDTPLALPGYLQSEYRDFKILVKIGEGGLSSVYRGVAVKPELQQRANGQLIAVKVMNETQDQATVLETFNQEVALMSDISRHDFFVKMIGFTDKPKTIIMKFYPSGDFAQFIHNTSQESQEWIPQRIIPLILDVCDALVHLHTKEIAHNDLKPANLFLDKRVDRLHLVLGDFSFAQVRSAVKRGVANFKFSDMEGMSLAYAAPEVFKLLRGQLTQEKLLTYPVHSRDVYALGVIIWETACRKLPWAIDTPEQIISHVISGRRLAMDLFNQDLHKPWRQVTSILGKCWLAEPFERPSAVNIRSQLEQIRARHELGCLKNFYLKTLQESSLRLHQMTIGWSTIEGHKYADMCVTLSVR